MYISKGHTRSLDDANAVSYVKGVVVLGQADVRLLLAVGPAGKKETGGGGGEEGDGGVVGSV